MGAPLSCPNCGETLGWTKVAKRKRGFSAGKGVAGGLLLGPLGLAAGGLGKKQTLYKCDKCGFMEWF